MEKDDPAACAWHQPPDPRPAMRAGRRCCCGWARWTPGGWKNSWLTPGGYAPRTRSPQNSARPAATRAQAQAERRGSGSVAPNGPPASDRSGPGAPAADSARLAGQLKVTVGWPRCLSMLRAPQLSGGQIVPAWGALYVDDTAFSRAYVPFWCVICQAGILRARRHTATSGMLARIPQQPAVAGWSKSRQTAICPTYLLPNLAARVRGR